MYDAFDRFLSLDLWRRLQGSEDDIFYDALAKVAERGDFNPDDMRQHMIQVKQLSRDNDQHLADLQTIDELAARATGVQGYLRAKSRAELREFEQSGE